MSQQQSAAKPSLQGVRIKARKGAVKAHAKHEPTGTIIRCDAIPNPVVHGSYLLLVFSPIVAKWGSNLLIFFSCLCSIQRSGVQAPRSYSTGRLRRGCQQAHPSRIDLRVPQICRRTLRHPHRRRPPPARWLVPRRRGTDIALLPLSDQGRRRAR